MKRVIIFLGFIFLVCGVFAQKQNGGVGNNYVGGFYNIADAPYNAKTSNSNNATAIQAAINACHANGGGTVYFPYMGLAWKTGKFVMYSNVRLQGDGYADTIQSATADTLITYDNANFNFAEGAQFDGLFLNGNSTGTVGISAQLLYHFHFSNSKVINFTQYGFYGKGILIGTFDNFSVDNCNIGIYLDSANNAGVIAPNIINFRGGEIRDNVTWAVQIKNSQGIGGYFDGVTFEGNGTSHNLSTGAVSWSVSTTVGLTFNNCWFEANKGILVFLGNSSTPITHTFIGCFMFQNSSASVGIDMNAASQKCYVNLIGTNLQSDSVDIKLDNVSLSAFFTNLQINLIGNIVPSDINHISPATINTAIPWYYINDGYHFPQLPNSTPTMTITAKNGAGTSPTVSVNTTYSSNEYGDFTVTTGTATVADDTLCIVAYCCAWITNGAVPELTPANKAAASLTGTAQVWPDGGGSFNYIYIFTNDVPLAPSTTYKWHLQVRGK